MTTRGQVGAVIYAGTLQTAVPLGDGTPLVTYVGTDRRIWHRTPAEFDDGRFASIGRDTEDGLGRFMHLSRGTTYVAIRRDGVLRTDLPLEDGAAILTFEEGDAWVHRPG